MSKIKTRKTQNALISKHFSLTADEAEVISQLTVRTGKVTAGRKRTNLFQWLKHTCKSNDFIVFAYDLQYNTSRKLSAKFIDIRCLKWAKTTVHFKPWLRTGIL